MEFPSTIWTVIRNAQNDPRGARELIIRRYWDPIQRYARLRGLSDEDAEDLAQTVFLHVCREGFLERADRNKGRFRALLVAMTNNLINHGWRERYAEGGGPRGPISLDEGKILEIADGAERAVPDASFNRAWAENVLRHAMERLKEESARLRTPYDRAVGAFYLEGRPYAEIARDLGCGEEKVRNYVFRGKARLGDFIREFIRDYSSGQEEFDEELRDLREFLGAGP